MYSILLLLLPFGVNINCIYHINCYISFSFSFFLWIFVFGQCEWKPVLEENLSSLQLKFMNPTPAAPLFAGSYWHVWLCRGVKWETESKCINQTWAWVYTLIPLLKYIFSDQYYLWSNCLYFRTIITWDWNFLFSPK